MRSRAKEHLPHVLLTLLSIIQALALELFWSELQGLTYLFELSWVGTSGWIQVAATFLGILVIWVVYATTVMRFSWVPSISDSVVPTNLIVIGLGFAASLLLLFWHLIFMGMFWKRTMGELTGFNRSGGKVA